MNEPSVRDDVEAFVGAMNGRVGPRLYEMAVPVARRVARRLARIADLPPGPIALDRTFRMPVEGGEIALRLFDNRPDRDAGPVVVYFHGGGWILGDTETYAPACAEIARELDLPLVSVEYRRAPEAKSPTGQMDCEAAARWIAANTDIFPFRATSLILAGDSCGGAYAISTAISLRDRPAAVPVIAQLIFYPSADLATRYPSFREFSTGYLLDKHIMRWFAENFGPDDTDYRASPLAADVTGLPPAVVVTAALDPLRDQGRAYVTALERAGVPVIAQEAQGMIHGFLTMRRVIPSAIGDVSAALGALKRLVDYQR